MSISDSTAAATATGSSSANFQVIFNDALEVYERRTKKDLLSHPLSVELETCNSPSAILDVLRRQAQGLDPSRWTKWLEPTVNVLQTFSDTIGEGDSLVFSPAKVIFAGVGVLLSAANDVQKSHGTLVYIFGHIENCFQRMEIYFQVRQTAEMMDTIIKIMVEVLTILGIATKEMKQSWIKKLGKRLIGRTDLEDALMRLDKLTNDRHQLIKSSPTRPPSCPYPSLADPVDSLMEHNLSHQNDRSQEVTIDVLPDDVLLEIFDFCVVKYQDLQLLSVVSGSLKEREQIRSWQSLVHVCRRWRCLVFGSPLRLNLQLQVFHVPGAPTSKSLDVWPSLPLLIHGDLSSTPMDNLIANLEHSDRICQINFYRNTNFQIEIENLWTAMQVPFPELEILRLSFKHGPNVPVLPDRFLGGSAPRLRYLELDSIPIQGLPNLFMSATHLVHLYLHDIPHSGYISPNAVATCLSTLTGLERLLLTFESPLSSPDQENRRLPPPTRSILPALTWFLFKGVSEYLEELVAPIDTPRLEQLSATFFNDIDFDTPELIRFVGRSLMSNAPNEARLLFDCRSASVKLLPQVSSNKSFLVKISCREPVWQLSSLAQICTTFLDLLSMTEDLFIYEPANSLLVWKDGIENIEWLDLLLPFTAVKNLYVSKEFVSRIAPALQEVSEGGPTEVLSTLQNLYLEGFKPSVSVEEGIERFISARRRANHPVAISDWPVWDTAAATTATSSAYDTRHKKTATWFFKGYIYQEWKSKGSLIWIHGKPGSGKSVLCSTIIEDIKILCEASYASMAYYYFDFRNANKQGLHDLLYSLLTQLSARSTACRNILTKLYSDTDDGKMRPSDSVLTNCLKDMLTLPDQHPIYLIIDALDECSATSGTPSARERVLQLLKELVGLRLDKLHLCVTSRPEIDIRDVLEPRTSLRVSLHDQTGQKEDIADYVRSVIYSNSEPIIRRWRKDDKDLVIKTLSERADGMFRWVFCQLEALRRCLPSSVRRSLEELPESLDETYERVLKEIKKPNRDHARRILQCLVVANRPLRVEELAEVLAVDFDDEIPKLKPGWRWEDHEKALFTSCSSLIAVVGSGDSRVVQFSHFSVREYLTSTRLALSSQDFSRYHITLNPAHTTLAQACISALLQFGNHDEQDDVEKKAPLARYAAEYWVRHAQNEDVASRLKGMDYLFDLDKPYFAAWHRLYDIDISPSDSSGSTFYDLTPSRRSDTNSSLYYAALCGFADLVERLMVKYPQHVDAISGYYMTPAVAALAGRHFQVAQLLLRHGSSVEPRGFFNRTPLHAAAGIEDLDIVQILLEYDVDINAQDNFGSTPLNYALNGYHDDPRVARLLIERGADLNIRGDGGFTPLHQASSAGSLEIARVLIEHGATIEVKNDKGKTPLDLASEKRHGGIIKLLLQNGAKRKPEDIVS